MGVGTIAVAGVVPGLLDKFEALLDPPLPGSEQFNLQQRRAIETWGASLVDRAFLQQRGMFPSDQDRSSALAPTAPPSRTITIVKRRARFSIPGELYLAGRTAVKVSLRNDVLGQRHSRRSVLTDFMPTSIPVAMVGTSHFHTNRKRNSHPVAVLAWRHSLRIHRSEYKHS